MNDTRFSISALSGKGKCDDDSGTKYWQRLFLLISTGLIESPKPMRACPLPFPYLSTCHYFSRAQNLGYSCSNPVCGLFDFIGIWLIHFLLSVVRSGSLFALHFFGFWRAIHEREDLIRKVPVAKAEEVLYDDRFSHDLAWCVDGVQYGHGVQYLTALYSTGGRPDENTTRGYLIQS